MFLYLALFLTIVSCTIRGQDSEWNGDPSVCLIDSSTPPPGPALPTFPTQAEFTIERIEMVSANNVTFSEKLVFYEYIYDYNANTMVILKNENGFVETEYYYYEKLKKSTYIQQKFCVVTDIPVNLDNDGASATTLENGTAHIRSLDEVLLFGSWDTRRPIVPTYIGSSVVRDIPVEQWQLCKIYEQERRTIRIQWSFARRNFPLAEGILSSPMAFPVERVITTSIVSNDGSQVLKLDEISNIFSYKPRIVEPLATFVLPKGTFCPNLASNLLTPTDVGIAWPSLYSVRVDATTTRKTGWNTFHLRVCNNEDRKRVRYDYVPTAANHSQTIIIDYRDQLRYIINRELGSCKIVQGVEWPDVDPVSTPTEFFFKLHDQFLEHPPINVWQSNGVRTCRGSLVPCTILTTSLENYPPIVDPSMTIGTGNFWNMTNIEFAWSFRSASFANPLPLTKAYDYPVHVFMRMYQMLNTSSPLDVHSEEVQYEFYEMSNEVNANDFDTSLCHRSRDFPYLHLAFTVNLNNGSLADSNHLDRKDLENKFRSCLLATMHPISSARINQLEINHDRTSPDNTVFVMFLLLGQAPTADPIEGEGGLPSSTNRPNDELNVEAARDKLRALIDAGGFIIAVQLLDGDKSNVVFKAVPNSLQSSRQFLSSHVFFLNSTLNTTVTETSVIPVTNIIVKNVTMIVKTLAATWSTGAEIGGVVGGLVIGLLGGLLMIVVIRVVRKEPMPQISSLSNASFYKRRQKNTEEEPHALVTFSGNSDA